MADPIRSSYLRAAEADAACLGLASFMRACFVAEAAAAPADAPLPPHAPHSASQRSRLRVAQWNVNALAGPCFEPPHVAPAAAAAVLRAINADLVFLQEAGPLDLPPPPPGAAARGLAALDPAATARRLADFHALLRAEGYALVPAEGGASNPALLATRLPLLRADAPASLDSASAAPEESRSARRALLALGSGARLAAVATHLHHTEKQRPGVRLAQARALLALARAAEAREAAAGEPPALASLVSTDFNGPRRGDYGAREWAVIERSVARAGEPPDDGVGAALRAAGWACSYDAEGCAPPPVTHWTGMTVDFAYARAGAGALRAVAARVVRTPLSDHYPVVHDYVVVEGS